MSKIKENIEIIIEKNKKKFGDLSRDILENINYDTGTVEYYFDDSGKKKFGRVNKNFVQHFQDSYFEKDSLIKIENKDEVDVISIIKKYKLDRHSNLPLPSTVLQHFRDTTLDPKSYEDIHRAFVEADEAFLQLPAEMRDKLNNDPLRLLELAKRGSIEELRSYGLLNNTSSESSPASSAVTAQGAQSATAAPKA